MEPWTNIGYATRLEGLFTKNLAIMEQDAKVSVANKDKDKRSHLTVSYL